MRYRYLIVILSLFVLPCCLLAQEVTTPDTVKVKTLEDTEHIHNVTYSHNSSLIPEKLSIIEGKPTNSFGDIAPYGYINSSAPQMPFNIQGASTRTNYIGLGATNSATFLSGFNYENLSAFAYINAQKHFYDYRTVTTLSVGASLSYDFDSNWSVTAFGQYVSPYSPFRPVVQVMMPVSGFGGYITYQVDNFSISSGVRREYNPYTMSWETNPIIMPQVKIGGVKLGVDLGPAIKNCIVNMQREKNPGPTPPQSGKGRR